jgi:Tol biopolymer transport system component
MPARFPGWWIIPSLVVLLTACGGAATPAEEILASDSTQQASATISEETPTPTEVVCRLQIPTLKPMAPLPGMIYTTRLEGGGSAGLWFVEANGETTELSDKPDPVLSPDRSQVLYSGNGDIWILDLTTGKTKNLTKTGDRVESNYQWWPARPGLIVFHFQPADDPGPGSGYLATVKPDGTNYLLLDEETGSFSPAAPSPDGQSIAFDIAGQPWVYHYTAGKMPIFPKSFKEEFKSAVNPAWSPDSRRIAWQLFGLSGGADGSSAIAILDLDAMQVSLLHRYPILGGGGLGIDHLAWSGDGEWLAAANQAELIEDREVSLWVMRPDGSEEHHIGPGGLPIWSPDGTMLVYYSGDGVLAVKAGEWIPFRITLPENAQVIDWLKIE